MHVLMVGGGKLVYFLGRTFLAKGYQVTVINRDHEECTQLARRLRATIVFGDGSDPQILQEAGADSADAVLAVTPNDEDNLVICQLAELRFHVPNTLAMANDPDNEKVFRQLGVTSAFSTTRILASLIEQKTSFDEITNLIPLGEGKVNITEVVLSATSPVIGRALRELTLPDNSLLAYILRDEQAIVPRGMTVLQAGDKVIVVALPENYGRVLRELTGNAG